MEKPDLAVQWVPLETLTPYENNSKIHDEANVSAIAESIRENGFRFPITAWHNEEGVAVIVSGHGRAMASKKLGLKPCPWCGATIGRCPPQAFGGGGQPKPPQ